MTTELATRFDMSEIEQVLVNGDLAKLTAPQRVQYYQRVCQSIGLNPLTKPFDYITLNGKLTLYAKKDATDQLRSIKGVSIDDVDLQESGDNFIVKVKGHDTTGRSDVEIGIVKKSDMQGNAANAQMKAVTKAKRRLTLSLCGLGWLDETEVETIRDAQPVVVKMETGEIVTPSQPAVIRAEITEQGAYIAHAETSTSTPPGKITPQMLVDNGISKDIPAAAETVNKLGVCGKPAAEYWPRVILYRKWRDAGHDTSSSAVAAIAGEQLP